MLSLTVFKFLISPGFGGVMIIVPGVNGSFIPGLLRFNIEIPDESPYVFRDMLSNVSPINET